MDAFELAEKGLIPDALIRFGIRRMLVERLREEDRGDPELQAEAEARFLDILRESPIAISTDDANSQHYEVPAELFRLILGKRLKYSSCYWPSPTSSLDEAEESMLELTCERAEIRDGMRVLELGCGWGSLTLWMAEHYPGCEIVAVSNSAGQRASIEADCKLLGVDNVTVVTADINHFEPDGTFDRVFSVEMFEHMRNYELLMRRIASWLVPGGKLFVHIFCHRTFGYLYEPSGPNDWMAREFFTGGTMPSDGLLLRFQDSLKLERQWRVRGTHYQRTLEAWLDLLDSRRGEVERVLARSGSSMPAKQLAQRWRLFLMACSELFGYRGGSEWWVSHYRFQRPEVSFPGL